ncbi:MAG: long-chain fatty acid--CoA ligase [Alicyclobacillus sp.]|nr:long-chain fatty acid--CoA ligase [Alicyclobacillus sp.]
MRDNQANASQANEPRNLLELLASAVDRWRERPALWQPEPDGAVHIWTYHHLWQAVYHAGSHLLAQGVGRGDAVALLAPNGAWWPVADFAIQSTGAMTVPLYPGLPDLSLQRQLAHCQARAALVAGETGLRQLCAVWPALPDLRFVVCIGPVPPAVLAHARACGPVYEWAAWLRKPALPQTVWETQWQGLCGHDTATVVYTSGTTSDPKGVILTHANLLANIAGIQALVSVRPTDRTLSYLPLSHIFERTAGQFVPLSAGAAIAYTRGLEHLMEDLRRLPPTLLTTVPRLLEKLADHVRRQGAAGPSWRQSWLQRALADGVAARVDGQALPRWRLWLADALVLRRIRQALGGRVRAVIVGGAPLPLQVGRLLAGAGVNILEGYGLTETAPVIAVNPPDAPRLGTVGKVLPNLQVKLAADGEICVRGPSVTPGYLYDAEATRQLLDADGWLHTGDVGAWSEEGYLMVRGRKKHVIVLSTGKKVLPAPVESAVLTSPYIDQVCLAGDGRKFVSAVVVPDEAAVAAWLQARGRSLARTEWARDDELRALLLSEVKRTTAGLLPHEQPKQVVVADAPFTLANGLLTPTLKVRGEAVLATYQAALDALYATAESTSGPEESAVPPAPPGSGYSA